MERKFIDINCDVGEGIGNEAELFPFISSCNIACGGHAGNAESMKSVVALAKRHNVKLGAHPSYPDKEGFGRVSIQMNSQDLSKNIQEQIENLAYVCQKAEMDIYHIKPHGALYNDIARDETLASAFLKSIQQYKSDKFLYVPYGSVIEKLALKEGFMIMREAFADRNYNDDLSLVSRKQPDALITEPKVVLEHILRMVDMGVVKTVSGKLVRIKADTYCIHGDTENALQILMYLSKELPNHNIYSKH